MMKSIAALWLVACSGSTHADKAPAEARVEDRSVSIAWGQVVSDLRLGLSVDGTSAVFHLENVGKAKLEVWSHVATVETHLDWYALLLVHNGSARDLRFVDDRNRSAPIKVTLDPGARVSHKVDVAAWAARAANNSQPLAPGSYSATATYEVTDGPVWHGKLASGQVALTVPRT
jgi:hypothetical protein